MLLEIINRYQDKESGKVYELGDLRDVLTDRGDELMRAGVAKMYKPINEKKGKKPDKPDVEDEKEKGVESNGSW